MIAIICILVALAFIMLALGAAAGMRKYEKEINQKRKHPITGKRLSNYDIEVIKDESDHGKIY